MDLLWWCSSGGFWWFRAFGLVLACLWFRWVVWLVAVGFLVLVGL